MDSTVVLLLSFSLASASDFYSRCLLFNKTCVSECPESMHPYHTRCDKDAMSQRTCESPYTYELGYTCGWSRCDCNGKLLLEEKSQLCVSADKCPTLDKKGKRGPKRKKSRKTTADDTEYTGHCPMLKFRFGKCYGENTRSILKEIRSKGLFNKPLQYRPGDNYELSNMPRRDRPKHDEYDGLSQRPTAYVTGYTGYVPGMNFRYGKSYGRAADDCMADFADHQQGLRRKADYNRSYVRSRSAPKMETIHSRDEIRRDLSRFREINKYKENTISPEFPPIAGYTGHIPRIKGSEASLSQRYHCAAKRGLELMRKDRDKMKELQRADANIRAILREDNRKYSYWNWG